MDDQVHEHTDHDKPTHTMNCPICEAPINVHAHDDEEAVKMMMEAGKQHFVEANHPTDQAMTEEEMEKMTRESMKPFTEE